MFLLFHFFEHFDLEYFLDVLCFDQNKLFFVFSELLFIFLDVLVFVGNRVLQIRREINANLKSMRMMVCLNLQILDTRGFAQLFLKLDGLFGEFEDKGLENFGSGLYVSVLFGNPLFSLIQCQAGYLIDALHFWLKLSEHRALYHFCYWVHLFLLYWLKEI